MKRNILLVFLLFLIFFNVRGQRNIEYLKANAVPVYNPLHLTDSVYNLLSPFQIFMVGEMHGANECAEFVTGLANLLTNNDDSVLIGLEIPEGQMRNFISNHTDSSLYQSKFFCCNPDLDGRESFAWASLISHLKNNPMIQFFFFDVNNDEEKKYNRDSIMYLKIKKQILLHPHWKVVTISGNAHASFTPDEKKAARYIRDDKELNLSAKLCTIYNYYLQGSCNANFGGSFEERKFDRSKNDWDAIFSFDKYLVILSSKTTLPYTAVYYTRNMTPSKMVKDNFDLNGIKKELKAIFERDQKTRTGADSASFMHYIDSCNQVQIKSLIAKYGWMGKSLIGNYNQVLFLVIQHADSATQEKYFPMLQQSVDEGESKADDLALMHDRILMRRGKKQIYGSQVVYDKTGKQIFYPIEDERNVNKRRSKAGLQPIEEYARYFGIEYKLPNK